MIPKIMGILNVTPNSFSDGGDFFDKKLAVAHAIQMIEDGATYIDIGGESTRPGSEPISIEEEINRTIPIISEILKNCPNTKISIDTTKYEVAEHALGCGASMINDISGLSIEPKFVELALNYNAELVIMHIKGTPKNMQIDPYYDNVVDEVYSYLESQAKLANGVSSVYVDVGIGFGKNLDHNFTLLNNLEKFNSITGKQLLGISRKSFIKMKLNIVEPKERDTPTAILHSMLLKKNIDILRVHNVKMISDMLKLYQSID